MITTSSLNKSQHSLKIYSRGLSTPNTMKKQRTASTNRLKRTLNNMRLVTEKSLKTSSASWCGLSKRQMKPSLPMSTSTICSSTGCSSESSIRKRTTLLSMNSETWSSVQDSSSRTRNFKTWLSGTSVAKMSSHSRSLSFLQQATVLRLLRRRNDGV